MPSGNMWGRSRREMLQYLGIAGAAGMAGCIGDDDGADGDDDTAADDGTDDASDDSTPADSSDGPEVGGSYVSGISGDGETLTLFQQVDTTSANYAGLTMDGAWTLQDANHDHEPFPLWMDVETLDASGEEYRCELRDNLYWSDPYGQMTAEDWVWYIHEIEQAEDGWTGSVDAGDWEGIDVEKTGDLSFEIRLPDPDPDFPMQPVMWNKMLMPKGLLEPYVEDRDLEGIQQDEEVNNLSYTGNLGPYEFERWDRESEFVATRNDDYYMHEVDDVPEEWNNAPYFEEYVYNVISEESTRLSALQTGEITATALPDSRVESFRENEDVYVNQMDYSYIRVIPYNMRENGWDPLRNPEVRRAFGYVIDKSAVLDQIQRGLGIPAHTFQPSWSEWYVDDHVEEFGVGETYDHDIARDMLEDALGSDYGYDGDELLGPNGQQVTLDFAVVSGNEIYETTAEYIQQEFRSVGIELDINFVEWSTLLGRYVANEYIGDGEPEWEAGPNNAGPRDQTASAEDWDLMYGINFNTYPRTPTATNVFWEEQGSVNLGGYIAEEGEDMAQLYRDASETADREERLEILGEIFGILSRDQPVSFMNFSDDIVGYRDNVEGPEPVFGQAWDSDTWYFES